MLRVTNIEVHGLEPAFRGLRNPMNSWDRSDSGWTVDPELLSYPSFDKRGIFKIGPKDCELALKMNKSSEQSKYRRMIIVWCDILAPLYWWKEFDTYKVGTVMNSCSTMHKIHSKEFTLNDFSNEHLIPTSLGELRRTIQTLNEFRDLYLGSAVSQYKHGEFEKMVYWRQMIQLLPTSYNQLRTVMFSYENAAAIIRQREGHKLTEWKEFIDFLKELPESQLIYEKGKL